MKILRITIFVLFAAAMLHFMNWLLYKANLKSDCEGVYKQLIEADLVEKYYTLSHSMSKKFNPFFGKFTPLTFSFEKKVNNVCYFQDLNNTTLELWIYIAPNNRETLPASYQHYRYDKSYLITLKKLKSSSTTDQSQEIDRLWDIQTANMKNK